MYPRRGMAVYPSLAGSRLMESMRLPKVYLMEIVGNLQVAN